ncbi:hypothetical protein ACHAQJ_009556 [Trichoderma viride]
MLLKRTKSGDLGKGNRKTQAEVLSSQHQAAPRVAPKLPDFFNNTEQLSKSFAPELQANPTIPSGHSARESSSRSSAEPTRTAMNKIPIPPIPNNGFDPYARSESMTNRGRYSYASSSAMSTINNPRRIRRRKDPTPFNVLILGSQNSGKTSFLEFLKTALALPPKKQSKKDEEAFQTSTPPVGNFIPHYLETEIDGERIGLTLWDSEGLEKNVIDLQLREMSGFLESKFEETFAEEMKVVRSPGVQDTHIHAAFYVMDPSRLDRSIATAKNAALRNGFGNGGYGHAQTSGALDEAIDLQVLRTLQHKTTVIPVISKADTITTKHMSILRKAVWDSIKAANLDPLEALGLDEDSSSIIEEEEDEEAEEDESIEQAEKTPVSPGHAKRLSTNSIRRHKSQEVAKEEEPPFLPLSIISPDLYEPGIIGRQFPWGFADPYNEEHCDFVRLKEAVFTEWRAELREASREQWYEGWRTNRLKHRDLPHAR